MADRDPLSGLHELARVGEDEARPLPVGRVHQLGNRRRRRRHVALAGATLALSLIAGAVVVTSTGVLRNAEPLPPPVAGTALPSPAPGGRTVTEDNLLRVSDVPRLDPSGQTVVETPDDVGRSPEQAWVCTPDDGLSSLGATASLQRNFRYEVDDSAATPDPDDPLWEQPVIYSQAYQFADAAAAQRARETYAGWLESCDRLDGVGYERLTRLDDPLTDVYVPNGAAAVAETVYKPPGETTEDEAFWESVGLTVVEDRMMVTVYLHYGIEWYAALKPSEAEFEHPQVGLVEAAAERLAS